MVSIAVLLGLLFIVSSYLSFRYAEDIRGVVFLRGAAGMASYVALMIVSVVVAPFETLPLLPVAVLLHAPQAIEDLFQDLAIKADQVGHQTDDAHLEADNRQDGRQDQRLDVSGHATGRDQEVDEAHSQQHSRGDEERAHPEEHAQWAVEGVGAQDGEGRLSQILGQAAHEA